MMCFTLRGKAATAYKPHNPLRGGGFKFAILLLWLFAGLYAADASAQGQLYRYVNDEGVKVLGQSIPPKYVSRGYEVLSLTGRVLQVIEPAPDPEQLKVERAKAALKERFDALSRRYSAVSDIDAAKQRKLTHVDASILLVDSSIVNIQKEIDEITASAAQYERAGKAVPVMVLDTLTALNDKMSATIATREQRLDEKTSIIERFDAEKKLFTEGVESFDPEAYKRMQAEQKAQQEAQQAHTEQEAES